MGNADYSIHLFEISALSPNPLLVAHMRYCGTDFEGDMALARQDTETHRWWALVSGCLFLHLDLDALADHTHVSLRLSSSVADGPDADLVCGRGDGQQGRAWVVGRGRGGLPDGELNKACAC